MTIDKINIVLKLVIPHYSTGVYRISKFEIENKSTLKVWYKTESEDFKYLSDDSHGSIVSYLNHQLDKYLLNHLGKRYFTFDSKLEK
jgi:hypothetical protein